VAGKRIKVWFPDHFTEAHRKKHQQDSLVWQFSQQGLDCVPDLRLNHLDVVFCGTTWQADRVREAVYRYNLREVPVVHYNWDLYPWQIEGEAIECINNHQWKPYVQDLKTCAAIVVPSRCTAVRTKQFTGRDDAVVVRSSVHLWDPPQDSLPHDGGYVLDVMRKYPDVNRHAVKYACLELGLPFKETGASLPWDEFRNTVLGARVLCSGYHEASTGGLTLLEGYAMGKPVLLSDSPYLGAKDYFGDRAHYFKWDDRESLKEQLGKLYHNTPRPKVDEHRRWVVENFSDDKYAAGIAAIIRGVCR
jgi:hypothetical protein